MKAIATRIEPWQAIWVMRRMLKQQCSDSTMPREVVRCIMDGGLLVLTHWPGGVISLTDAGRAYLAEHDTTDDEESR